MEQHSKNLLKPAVIQTERLSSQFIKLDKETLLLPPHYSHSYNYYVIRETKSAVFVIARTRDLKYVINLEYRHPTGQFLYGLPGGIVDANESIIHAAQRELLEETGYGYSTSSTLQLSEPLFSQMGSSYPMPGLSSMKYYFVKANYPVEFIKEPHREPSENIKVLLLEESELNKILEETDSYPCDSSLLVGLQLFKKSTMQLKSFL